MKKIIIISLFVLFSLISKAQHVLYFEPGADYKITYVCKYTHSSHPYGNCYVKHYDVTFYLENMTSKTIHINNWNVRRNQNACNENGKDYFNKASFDLKPSEKSWHVILGVTVPDSDGCPSGWGWSIK